MTTRQRPAGTEICGGCDGLDIRTPQAPRNRPGLTAIAYRIGQHADFKHSLLARLSSTANVALRELRTRDADDFTIALADAVACAADVLTFYQERIANESYLRTAAERVSLQELARLIGYRLRPGVAAETPLAFALEPPRATPSGTVDNPGALIAALPDAIVLPAGLQVQSVPGPNQKPQTFETVETMEGRPAWNAIRPWQSEARRPRRDDTGLWVSGIRANLKAGDGLVFVDDEFVANPAGSTWWDFRVIDRVVLDAPNDRTHVTWRGGLGGSTEPSPGGSGPRVYVLRRRTAVFGHNAPQWTGLNMQFRTAYGFDEVRPDEWPSFTISALPANDAGGHVDLDGVFAEIMPGSLAVLTRGAFSRRAGRLATAGTSVQLYVVESTAEVSRAEFALAAKVTRLGLDGPSLDTSFVAFPRDTTVYAQSEPLTLAPYPVDTHVAGDIIPVAMGADGLHRGRRVIVKGARVDSGVMLVHDATIVSVESAPHGALLTIAPPVPWSLDRGTVVVHANVALATHGETVGQILGSGDGSQSFQRFELKRPPLTYRAAPTETGTDSELTVRVGDVAWTETPTLYGAAPDERAFTVTVDEQGVTSVVFGDGRTGARLPSGSNNVRATYRAGIGASGNVGAGTLTQLPSRPLGLKSVSNPRAAEGGTDPEPASRARRSMPLGTRTLGRAVSLLDYEDFAMAFAGVAKAHAAVLQLRGGPVIAITIAAHDGAPISTDGPLWANLARAFALNGDPNVAIALLPYRSSTFRVGLKVKRDPVYDRAQVLHAVEWAIRARFSFEARALGQPVLQSEVIAAAHTVPGVAAVDLDLFYGGTAPATQTIRSLQVRLLALRMGVVAGVAHPAELLTLDPAPFDRLEEMS